MQMQMQMQGPPPGPDAARRPPSSPLPTRDFALHAPARDVAAARWPEVLPGAEISPIHAGAAPASPLFPPHTPPGPAYAQPGQTHYYAPLPADHPGAGAYGSAQGHNVRFHPQAAQYTLECTTGSSDRDEDVQSGASSGFSLLSGTSDAQSERTLWNTYANAGGDIALMQEYALRNSVR
jgi:hypothetical protein